MSNSHAKIENIKKECMIFLLSLMLNLLGKLTVYLKLDQYCRVQSCRDFQLLGIMKIKQEHAGHPEILAR